MEFRVGGLLKDSPSSAIRPPLIREITGITDTIIYYDVLTRNFDSEMPVDFIFQLIARGLLVYDESHLKHKLIKELINE